MEVHSEHKNNTSIFGEILGKLKAAGRLAGGMLEHELSIHIEKGEFWINNSYHSLRSSYDFFRDETEASLNALETFESAPQIENDGMEGITERFNEGMRHKRIITYRSIPLINSFFSLLEFLLDAFFSFEQPTGTFLEFRQLNWQDRMKLVVLLEPGSNILKCYEQIVRIKTDFRNPLTHGLTNKSVLLVPVPFGGLVPVSYEHLSNTLHFGMTQISPRVVREIVSAFDRFLDAVEKKEPYAFYLRYLESGFSLPASKKEADPILKEMSDMETFEQYLEDRSMYEDAVVNRDL